MRCEVRACGSGMPLLLVVLLAAVCSGCCSMGSGRWAAVVGGVLLVVLMAAVGLQARWWRGCSAAQHRICMAQAAHGCCTGSRPVRPVQHGQLLHAARGLAASSRRRPFRWPAVVALFWRTRTRRFLWCYRCCFIPVGNDDGALLVVGAVVILCARSIRPRRVRSESCESVQRAHRLLRVGPRAGRLHISADLRCSLALLPAAFPSRGTMYARVGTVGACSGEPEHDGSPCETVPPFRASLTCGFPLEGNDVRTGVGVDECAPAAHSCAAGAHFTAGYHPGVMTGGVSRRRGPPGAAGSGASAARFRTAGR